MLLKRGEKKGAKELLNTFTSTIVKQKCADVLIYAIHRQQQKCYHSAAASTLCGCWRQLGSIHIGRSRQWQWLNGCSDAVASLHMNE